MEGPSHRDDPKRRPGRSFRRLLLLIAGAVAIFAVGILLGVFILGAQVDGNEAVLADATTKLGEIQKALAASEDRNWTYSRENETLKAELQGLRAASGGSTTTSLPTVPGDRPTASAFSAGVYLVGEDIAAGEYDGEVTGDVGYWARLSDTDGSVHAIIANGLPRGPFVLTLLPSDKAVELLGVKLTAR